VRPLSITHVDTESAWRGGQQSLLTLARGLRDRGHTQTIVCPDASALAERARDERFVVITKCPRTGDIVHAHSGRAHNLAVRATLGASITRVVTRHVAFTPKHPMIHRLKYTKTCDGVIAVSDAVSDVLVRMGVPKSHVQVIHTGIEIPDKIERREHDGLVVGHLGAFTREKGQDVVVEAARELPHVRFVLAGEGALLEELKRSAPKNVVFPGFVTDAAGFFAGIDLFVMPSRSEAWGLAALEAMAHGVPVIASNIQGLAEIVTPETGWLIPSGNVGALARAISGADRTQLRQMGLAARERARGFSTEAMARETEAFYNRVHRLS
jgi:glycosyltransferase involved in cell wall biosynthesis